jgi:aminomethyltransferase
MPRALPLADLHAAAGARLEERHGFLIPMSYGDPAAEHRAVMTSVGLSDRSFAGKAVVTGRDGAAFLHGMLTADVKGLRPGEGCGAAFLDSHGKVLALVGAYALEDRLWLDLPTGLTQKTLGLLDHYLFSEKAAFEEADDAFVILSVQGREAPGFIERLTGGPPPGPEYHHLERVIGGGPVRVMSRWDGPAPGYHCWAESGQGAALWKALRHAGAIPVGFTAQEALRVEAGQPRYGEDVDEDVLLPETGLEAFVSYTKGCYIGQEVVARVKYRGHVNRRLVGLTLEGGRAPARGAAVMHEDREVGRITSPAWSFGLGMPIALAYVRREYLAPGTLLSVDEAGERVPARITRLPFVEPLP